METADSNKSANEIRSLATNLAPFGDLSFNDFSAFLVNAEAYSRGELQPIFPKPKAKAAPKPKTPKASEDPDIVAKIIVELRTLYDRALDPTFSDLQIDDALKQANSLNPVQLAEVATGCGFYQKFKTKKASIAALRKWILGRKGTHERAGA